MGLSPLSQYKLYWHQNDFNGNSGMRKQWHAEDAKSQLSIYIYMIGLMSQLEMVLIDKLYKICPVLNMVQHSFVESYKPGQNQTGD